MNSINFKKGAILLGANNHPKDGNHYIVYFDELDGIDFIGGMISTKDYHRINIPMKPSHFEVTNNVNGTNWKITYYYSHLVPAKLHKFNSMGEFTQVGQLTDDGLEFVSSIITDKNLLTWEEYQISET
jgi:hypothetical protein